MVCQYPEADITELAFAGVYKLATDEHGNETGGPIPVFPEKIDTMPAIPAAYYEFLAREEEAAAATAANVVAESVSQAASSRCPRQRSRSPRVAAIGMTASHPH